MEYGTKVTLSGGYGRNSGKREFQYILEMTPLMRMLFRQLKGKVSEFVSARVRKQTIFSVTRRKLRSSYNG